MTKYTVLHNPRCTKSRNALKLLEEQGVSFEVREYLVDNLELKELTKLLAIGDFDIKDLIRNKEAKEAAIETKNKNEIQLLKAIEANPKIMQRPVVIKNKKATIARDDDWFTRL